METETKQEVAQLRHLANMEMLSSVMSEYLEQVIQTLGVMRQGYERALTEEEREASGEYQGLLALEGLACDVYQEATECLSELDEAKE